MADESGNNATGTKDQDSSTIFNSEIGDDWGEAFEAEDFMFSPDEEADSDFFLDDGQPADSAPAPKKTAPTTGAKQPPPQATFPEQQERVPAGSLMSRALFFGKLQKNRFLTAPLPIKISAIAAPIAVLAIVLFLGGKLAPDKKTDLVTTADPVAGSLIIPESETANGAQEIELPSEPVIEKVRKKWPLPSFLIAATSDKGDQEPALVTIDITLNLLLAQEDMLPEDKEVYVRELIYQFFSNRPLYELRRYSLARGEMNRKLRAWIEKQWPEIPLASITFNRYQIL